MSAPANASSTILARNMSVSKLPGSQNMLTVSVKDKPTLYASYMPFLKNAGLFIILPPNTKTDIDFKIGGEIVLLLSLPDEPQKLPVAGKIVWITPEHAEGNMAPGFGVQFDDQEGIARNKIEGLLAGSDTSGRPTHTM